MERQGKVVKFKDYYTPPKPLRPLPESLKGRELISVRGNPFEVRKRLDNPTHTLYIYLGGSKPWKTDKAS